MHEQTTLAGLAWRADTAAAELLCDLGELAMRHREPGRITRAARATWHTWPAFLARTYTRETWQGTPGPLPVKVLLFAAAIAEPGPYGEMALGAFANWNGRRKARKAGAR